MTGKQNLKRLAGSLLAIGLMSGMLVAETAASRYDNQLQNAVTQKLTSKSQYREVKASVEDGIVTLAGTVDLYQRKLDAGKLARKTSNSQGVRNLITVAGPNIPDAQLEQKLATKLTYVRAGYDSTFDYFAIGVKDGVVTVEGQDRTGVGRDEALAKIANMRSPVTDCSKPGQSTLHCDKLSSSNHPAKPLAFMTSRRPFAPVPWSNRLSSAPLRLPGPSSRSGTG